MQQKVVFRLSRIKAKHQVFVSKPLAVAGFARGMSIANALAVKRVGSHKTNLFSARLLRQPY
jgi:hypothetical protein